MAANVLLSTSALEPGPAQGLDPWWERKLTFEMCMAFIFSLSTLLRSVCFLSGTSIDILEEPEVNDTTRGSYLWGAHSPDADYWLDRGYEWL